MLLLATITGSAPLDIAAWMGCAYFAFGLWNAINKAIDRNRVRPEPSQTYATKADMERHAQENRQEHQNLFAKIGGVERGVREDVKTDLSQVHDKINAVAREVTGLTTATEMQTDQLARIEGKLDSSIMKGRH